MHDNDQDDRHNTLPIWPPRPEQWPPIPPISTVSISPPAVKNLLQASSPIFVALMVAAGVGGYSHIMDPHFIANPAGYAQAQRLFIAAGIGLIALLSLWIFRAIPWLFRHYVYINHHAEPFARHRFFVVVIVMLYAFVMNISSFPMAMLEQLHEHTAYTVFQQDVQIIAKSYQDHYQFTLRAANGQTFQINTQEAVYDQTVVGSNLHLVGTETPYGRLVVEQSVASPRAVALADVHTGHATGS